MIAIYKRELASYANNMMGGLCVAFMIVCVGLYFFANNLSMGYPSFAVSLYNASFLFLVIVPLLTMRSLSEERRSKTDQLLLTSPVTVTGVVLGKYLAMLTVFALPCLLFCLCPLIMLAGGGNVYFGTDYATILCFFLLGGVYIAVGLLVSALTESQVIAAVGSFGILLVLYLWDGIISLLPTSESGSLWLILFFIAALALLVNSISASPLLSAVVAVVLGAVTLIFWFVDSSVFASLVPDVLGTFSFSSVLQNFARNQVFDLAGLLMYLSITALLLFLTVQVIQRRRWH
jgi:ABC-2 type transport system permease protein